MLAWGTDRAKLFDYTHIGPQRNNAATNIMNNFIIITFGTDADIQTPQVIVPMALYYLAQDKSLDRYIRYIDFKWKETVCLFWTWIIPDWLLKNSSVEKHKNKICNEEVWLCFKRIATWAHVIPAAMILVLLISHLMINQELEKLRPAPLCKMPTVYSKGAGEFSVGGQA